MAKSIAAPTRYYQGSLLLSNFYRYVSHIGRNFVIISDKRMRTLVEDRISEGFENSGSQCSYIDFGGECCNEEIEKLSELTMERNANGVIGVGGGKAIDTAKMVGDICGLPVVTAPTSASTEASCTCFSSIYSKEGKFQKILRLKNGPDVVLVDTDIISKAPSHLFVSGIGNAFSTYYESRSCERSGVQNYFGCTRTHSTMTLAKLCWDLLLKNGAHAKADVEAKKVTRAVETVVEANIYLSGMSYVNNGCAASQGIYAGLTSITAPSDFFYGEGNAYGLLVQLIMEYTEANKWAYGEWDQVIDFYKSVELPLKLSDLGITNADETIIGQIAKTACVSHSSIHNMPFEVNEKKVCNAIEQLENMSFL